MEAPLNAGAAPSLPESNPQLVAATDQSIGQILIFDAKSDEPTDDACRLDVVWSWRPAGGPNGSPNRGWGRPADVRLRRDAHGELCMVAADSYGLVVAVRSDGRFIWSADVGPNANPHAVELLPGDVIAVAASTGGWVRLYAGLAHSAAAPVAELKLADAHGLLWDPGGNVLWALGDEQLCALEATMSSGNTGLHRRLTQELPSKGGHDLQPVYGSRDLLWVTTRSCVYQFSKTKRTWSTAYPYASAVNRANVKSIGTNPLTGEVLQTVPAASADPEWVTDTIEVVAPVRRHWRRNAQFYKARYWVADYQ